MHACGSSWKTALEPLKHLPFNHKCREQKCLGVSVSEYENVNFPCWNHNEIRLILTFPSILASSPSLTNFPYSLARFSKHVTCTWVPISGHGTQPKTVENSQLLQYSCWSKDLSLNEDTFFLWQCPGHCQHLSFYFPFVLCFKDDLITSIFLRFSSENVIRLYCLQSSFTGLAVILHKLNLADLLSTIILLSNPLDKTQWKPLN